MLQCISEGLDISGFDNTKEKGLIQSLYRKGAIDDNNQITLEGRGILEYLETPEKREFSLKSFPLEGERDFEEWWGIYPGTDTIIRDKKIVIKGSRSLRNDKEGCKVKFLKILQEGTYKANQIISALKYEVDERISKSLREHKNHLSFMKNSLTYLNQKSFESFIEVAEISSSSQEISSHTTGGIVGI